MTDNEIPPALTALLHALGAHDVESAAEQLADGIVLKSPIFADPFIGIDVVKVVLGHLLNAVDEFAHTEIIAGEGKFAVLLKLKAGDTEIEGVDIVSVDTDGKIDAMTVQWRPLAAIVAVQNRLAPAVGVPALTLAETS